jgi:hypothetical protein
VRCRAAAGVCCAYGINAGAIAKLQGEYARGLIEKTGSPVNYLSFPRMGHSMHGQDPELFTKTLVDWAMTLPVA